MLKNMKVLAVYAFLAACILFAVQDITNFAMGEDYIVHPWIDLMLFVGSSGLLGMWFWITKS